MSSPLVGPEPEVLRRVQVRLLGEPERPKFDWLLTKLHYLHDARLTGQSLRSVAEVDGRWVALVSFSAAALHLKAREHWIGWSARQRARRLALVVNNSRFLVLPERQRYPNLASRVLGLCLRRLSSDWQQHWGHPVLVVESFVAETQYRGTCYRACGFAAVGLTQGFGRASRDFYLPHGQPKQLYLRELQPGARRRLRQARWPAALAPHEAAVAGPCPFQAPALASLLERLAALPDTRCGHGLRHRQRFVLACAAVSTLMGACGYRAFENTCQKFTQHQLRARGCQRAATDGRYDPPSDSTFQRVLKRVDAGQLASIVGGWLAEQEVGTLARLAIDGKVLELTAPGARPSVETGYYVSSLSVAERTADEVGTMIRDHWSAIENGTHYRRDVTLGEDANRTTDRVGAAVLATLRNLANGLYELQQARGATAVDSFKSWCQQQTFSSAWKLMHR
jgi:hypothetical protein